MDAVLDSCGRRRVRALLLLHLFIVSGAAECPKPLTWQNMVLTNEALLQNNFKEGAEITYECANGYEKEEGSGTSTCTGGEWTNPDLQCKKKDCGLPRPQPHMAFIIDEGTLFGASVKVICDKGYELSGTAYKDCYASGWSGRARCDVVTCVKPNAVANGRSSWDSDKEPEYGEIIEFFCDDGHTLIGNKTIECTETGQYSSPPPECEEFSTTTASSSTYTTHRDKIISTSVTPAAPTPEPGGRDVLTTEDKITTTRAASTASPPGRGKRGDVDTNKDTGAMPVIVSVISTVIVVLIVLLILHHFLLKRKGSYDTGEDLKPELLQFQNL
ncbi:complement decay-accelerating factor transmembrane isoform isoform X5 [Myripristis murdjan]|uniref:complement decay-accelerating factor transmembrane isoform isoform X5 n=1 Tax=Myripristis murdjan TaxID=586833 RepID=UPI0011763207|nr:complement decay-accelerating factor transmembrane isoform-like isoform X5 [Myripristis murdjan]